MVIGPGNTLRVGSEPLTAAEGVVAMEAMEESTTNWVTCPLCGERAFSLSLSRADLLRRHQETACPHSPEANSFIDPEGTGPLRSSSARAAARRPCPPVSPGRA